MDLRAIMRDKVGTGIGRYSASGEALDHERIMDAWDARLKAGKGRIPGTHSLGKEFSRNG